MPWIRFAAIVLLVAVLPVQAQQPGRRTMLGPGTFFVGLGDTFDPGLGPGAPVGGFIAIPPRHPRFA